MQTWGNRVALPSLQNCSWHSRMIFAWRWAVIRLRDILKFHCPQATTFKDKGRKEGASFGVCFFCPVNHEGYIRVTFREASGRTYVLHLPASRRVRTVFESLGKVEVLRYICGNHRLIRDGSPGRPPHFSHSSWALGNWKMGWPFQGIVSLWKFVNFVVFRALGKNYQLICQKLHFPRLNSSCFFK